MNDENNELYCPIRKTICVGKKCVFAVKIDDPFSNPYSYYYICGLVNVPKHGIPKTLALESRDDTFEY